MDKPNGVPIIKEKNFNHGDFQFYHNQTGYTRHTYAVEVPYTKYSMLSAFNSKVPLLFNFGMTTVHPKDKYNKNIGREYAKARSEAVEFIPSRLNYEGEKTFIIYENSTLGIRLEFRLHDKSERVNLVNIFSYFIRGKK